MRPQPVPPFDVVVLAASLGGPAALVQVLGALPADYPVPVVVVQHRAPGAGDGLVSMLRRPILLPVVAAVDGVSLRAGEVTIAPVDSQMTLSAGGRIDLAELSPVHPRATADQLFVSAAATYGPRTLAVVLTGRLSDGAVGVRAVKRAGGRVLVQDQATSRAFGMPAAALGTGCIDFVLPLETIGPALVTLLMAPGGAGLLQVPTPHWATVG